MAEIKAASLDRYLIMIPTLWRSIRFNSQISTFWDRVPLILQPQGTYQPPPPPPLKNTELRYLHLDLSLARSIQE